MIDIIIILTLISLHGLFAMIEIAFVSAKKVRLEEWKNRGNKNAGLVLHLLEEPDKFLSTIQVGITVMSILAGVYGGARIAHNLAPLFAYLPVAHAIADELAFITVVFLISYLEIVIGDLVPKTLALSKPEKLAVTFAPVMKFVMKISFVLIAVLSFSTRLIIKLFFIKGKEEPPITEEELRLLIDLGSQHGVLENRESEILHSILRFNDITVRSLMTKLHDVIWLKFDDPLVQTYNTILKHDFSRYPVCEDSIDNIVGIISGKEFLIQFHSGEPFKLEDILFDPLLVRGDMSALKLLDKFQETRSYLAFVVDENGALEGIITLHDLVVHIVGELPENYETQEDKIYKR
ncbi:MAG: HlyC/CorC family transporter [Ignavibacteriales bacterium]|nr:HlyC/CorC family transporter [Ignavibacteriales bacterium]